MVEEAMQLELQASNVQVYTDCILAQWNGGTECDEINTVAFTTSDQPLNLDCNVSCIVKSLFSVLLALKAKK